tara:strand:- start:210 stop:836 length:627 start_codon:yes stop_codon:yes gene_type:complete
MSELKITADSGGGSVSLKGPATTTGNNAVPFVLPVADGSAGQYLKTDGSKNLSFATVSVPASNGITGPSFTVRRTGSHQNISTSTTTVVEFNSEDQDSNSAWDTSTYRFTPQVAGWYNISSQICYNTAVENHWMLIYIHKNGSIECWAQLHTDNRAVDHLLQINKMVNLNGSSDYIDIRTWQDSGSTRGLQYRSGEVSWAQGFLVRAT